MNQTRGLNRHNSTERYRLRDQQDEIFTIPSESHPATDENNRSSRYEARLEAISDKYGQRDRQSEGFIPKKNRASSVNITKSARNAVKVYIGKVPFDMLSSKTNANIIKILHRATEGSRSKSGARTATPIALSHNPDNLSKDTGIYNDEEDYESEDEHYNYENRFRPQQEEQRHVDPIAEVEDENYRSAQRYEHCEDIPGDYSRKLPVDNYSQEVVEQQYDPEVFQNNRRILEHGDTAFMPHTIKSLENLTKTKSGSRSNKNIVLWKNERDADKGERLDTDLEYSNTQHLRSSVIGRDSIVGDINRESAVDQDSSSELPTLNPKMGKSSRDMDNCIRTISRGDYSELIAKPLLVKKESREDNRSTSRKQTDSNFSQDSRNIKEKSLSSQQGSRIGLDADNKSIHKNELKNQMQTGSDVEEQRSDSRRKISYSITMEQDKSCNDVVEQEKYKVNEVKGSEVKQQIKTNDKEDNSEIEDDFQEEEIVEEFE